MKSIKSIFAALVLCCTVNFSFGQDLHFSQYKTAPQLLNPALTGFQTGNLRANLNYRNQWYKASSYSTYSFGVDGNFMRDKLDLDMFGVGLTFFHDIEQKNGLSNTSINLSAAYNVKITERPLQYIGFGVQPSLLKKQINLGDAIYGELFENGVNVDPLGFGNFGGFKFDINMGLSYYVLINQMHGISLGFTMSHINQPDFGEGGSDPLFRKYTAYALGEIELGLSGLAWLKPTLYFTKQGPSVEFLPGVAARIQFFNAAKEVFLGFGVGTRMVGHQNAKLKLTEILPSLQFTYEMVTFAFSYDVAVGDLKAATSRNGGPEIGLVVDLDIMRNRKPRYFGIMSY